MPKLVVLVEKDDTGKLWNYIFTEDQWAHCHNSFRGTPQWIHKSGSTENISECLGSAEPVEKERIALHILSSEEEPKKAFRTRRKSSSS